MFLLRTADTLDLYMSETKKFYEKIHEEWHLQKGKGAQWSKKSIHHPAAALPHSSWPHCSPTAWPTFLVCLQYCIAPFLLDVFFLFLFILFGLKFTGERARKPHLITFGPSRSGGNSKNHCAYCNLIECSLFFFFTFLCCWVQYVVNKAQQNYNNKRSHDLESLSMVLNCHT